jgi:hypothetical protein
MTGSTCCVGRACNPGVWERSWSGVARSCSYADNPDSNNVTKDIQAFEDVNIH